MTLTIELNPEEEARLVSAARQQGLDPATLARKLVTEPLPRSSGNGVNGVAAVNGDSPADRVRRLLKEWQAQDNTPPVVAGTEPLPGKTPAQTLFRTWAEEDAAMTDAEREAEDKLWADIEAGLAQNDGLRLRRSDA